MEFVCPKSLFLTAQANDGSHEMPFVRPFRMSLFNVAKQILALMPRPTVGALVFRDSKQSSIEELRQR
jgi:hypothetical protein